MADPNWGMLSKSQDDNETIEQAIERIVASHNDDSEAHIGEGRSLQSHKASEIIDHLADSIVSDKILSRQVTGSQRSFNQTLFETMFETMDCWTFRKSGYGYYDYNFNSVQLGTGDSYNNWSMLALEVFCEGNAINFLKNPRFKTTIRLIPRTGRIIYVGMGGSEMDNFGFKIIDNTFYALHTMDIDEVSTEYLTPISFTFDTFVDVRLEAVYTSGSKIEFYLNNILVATHTSNLPETGTTATSLLEFFFYRIINQSESHSYEITLRNLSLMQDE